jgi:hypothetical protein
MIKQEKDCGIRASGVREVLGGKIRDDGGDHLAEVPSDPAGDWAVRHIIHETPSYPGNNKT